MTDPVAIIHKKSTNIITKLKPWNLYGVSSLINITKKPYLRNPYYSIALAIQKSMERYELKIFKSFLKPGMTVLDVGANIGMYTKVASSIVGEGGKVFAFEPEQENLKILKKCIRDNNLHNVVVVEKALSDETGHARLYIDEVNLGNHSFSEKNLLKGSSFINIKSTTIDEYFQDKGEINLIKIDVQGAEDKTIQGARNVLEKYKPTIMIEFWPEGLINCGSNPLRLLNQLKRYGFEIMFIDKTHNKLYKVSPDQLVNICKERRHDTDYTNLVLSARI